MAPTVVSHFVFIEQSAKNSSQREKELRWAEIRAHAAKVAHFRKHEAEQKALVLRGATQQHAYPCIPRYYRTALGEGRMDPFNTLSSQPLPIFVNEILDHTLTSAWPGFMPTPTNDILVPFKKAWVGMAMEQPAALHAFIYAATVHLHNLRNGQEVSKSAPILRNQYHSETLRSVREAIAQLQGPPPDALIVAVAVLSANGKPIEGKFPQYHPASPLSTAQSLHLFSKTEMMEPHFQALNQLVVLKGGLGGIKAFGLVEAIVINDIFYASRTGRKPCHPFPVQVGRLVPTGLHVPDAQAKRLRSRLGCGFKELSCLNISLSEVLDHMCDLTAALDHYQRREKHPPSLDNIILVRNAAQHKLLSLNATPTYFIVGHDGHNQVLRLAALIFSDIVLFALGPETGIKPRVAAELRESIERWSEQTSFVVHEGLMLWALTLGGIAALATPHRSWYAHQLAINQIQPHPQDFDRLRAAVSQYLWWDFVCEEPALKLWAEADQSI